MTRIPLTVGFASMVVVIVLGSSIGCMHRTAPATNTRPTTETARPITDPLRLRRIQEAGLTLRPVDDWACRRLFRQRVRIDWPGGSESFDAVLQRRPGELTLFGLGPMNLVGFRLSLLVDGGGSGGPQRVVFENRSGRELPFSAAHVLADIQRVFYPWLGSDGEPDFDCDGCERVGRWGSVAVSERGRFERPTERRFVVVDAPEAGEVQIRFTDWQGEPAFPRTVELENDWFDYTIRIETLESSPVPPP